MSSNSETHQNIDEILGVLKDELQNVANIDFNISNSESKFIDLINTRIPSLKTELDHIFKDDEVTEYEKIEFYEKLGELMKDAVDFCREDDRIDVEEMFLITKLKQQLSAIIKNLRVSGSND